MDTEARDGGRLRDGEAVGGRSGPRLATLPFSIYLVAFVTGAIVMSFEMLGSRYLGPHFGVGIYTWASLISTVLVALCFGYFLGGLLADRYPSPTVLGVTVLMASLYLLLLPAFADPVLQFFVWNIDDIKWGSLLSALAIMLIPVTFLGMYSPFAIRLLLQSRQNSGVVSGTVYGVSTAGSILGTLGTTFFLIPLIGSRAITYTLGILGILAGALLVGGAVSWWRRVELGIVAALVAVQALAWSAAPVRAEELFDPEIRAEMLKRKNGLITHIETVYNDIFVSKDQNLLKMTFQWKGWYWPESVVNLADPDDLPMPYARAMSLAAIYPPDIKRVLVLGLGAGSVSTYLGRFLKDATIDAAEVDPGVIDVAKKYFGLRESNRSHVYESDGRVFLNRHNELYDLIIADAFSGSYIPFHMMTKEFYQLVRERLAPHGVAGINIIPAEKLFDSNVRTLKLAFDNVDFYHAGEQNVVVVAGLDSFSNEEKLKKAAAAQERYKFRFDVSRLITEERIEVPNAPKGDVLTDDFAPANVYDAYGHRYSRKK